MANVALVTKDTSLAELISGFLEKDGHEVKIFTAYNSDVTAKKPDGFEVIVVDDHLLVSIGMYFPVSSPKLIIIVSSTMNSSSVMKKIREGVWDCIQKPIMLGGNYIPSTVEALKKRILSSIKVAALVGSQKHDIEKLDRSKIIGKSHAIESCLASLIFAIESDQSILITGETGVGKELLAEAAHKNSHRSEEPFIAFNCSSIPESIAEGILFGWKKGAHNQADADKDGLLKAAHQGTLFLDEIEELSPKNQAMLLRCIQEKEVLPLGASRPEKIDFRLVSATNQDLLEMVKNGKFRQDLYYRINASTINVPPLRDRREDIWLIAKYYIESICRDNGITPTKICTEDFFDALEIYDWPGNVRQLVNEVYGAISRSGKTQALDIHYLSTDLRAFWISRDVSQCHNLLYGVWEDLVYESIGDFEGDEFIPSVVDSSDGSSIEMKKGPTVRVRFTPGQIPTLDECVTKLKHEYLAQLNALVTAKKVKISEAAEIMGMNASSYHRLMKEHGL